ncbi:MAG: DUF805 domain-containing protein [Notoacmeibacter sp.]
MLTFFFIPVGRLASHPFTLGWLFWLSLEMGCLLGFMGADRGTPAYSYWFVIGMIVSSLSVVSIIVLGVKRLRDAAMPIWPAIILLVPGLSLIALVVMSNLPSRNSDWDAKT